MAKNNIKQDKIFFGELFIIIGGFILAETLGRFFLDISEKSIPIWILGGFAYLLINLGFLMVKNREISLLSILYLVYLGTFLIFILLRDKVSQFVWILVVLSIPLIFYIVYLTKGHKQKNSNSIIKTKIVTRKN